MFAFIELYCRASRAIGRFIVGIFMDDKKRKNQTFGETPIQIQKIQYSKYVQGLEL